MEFNENNVVEFSSVFLSELKEFCKTKFNFRIGHIKFSIDNGDANSCVFFKNDCFFMKIGVKNANRSIFYSEYDFIKKDKEIGNLPTLTEDGEADWMKYVAALLCHEMAHVIDMLLTNEEKNSLVYEHNVFYDQEKMNKKDQRKYHGKSWQTIYRIFRNEFVNGRIFM